MDTHTFQVLEFDKTKSALASRASSPLGRCAAMGLAPAFSVKEIEDELDRVTELERALDSDRFSPGPMKDIREALQRCSLEGNILSAEEIFDIAVTLMTARKAKTFFDKNKDDYPLLQSLVCDLSSYQEFEKAAFRSLNEEGVVLDSASQELASIRRNIEKTKKVIRSKLDSIMRSSRNLLQENLVTIREGRFVIPIKSEGKRRVKCVVHDVSASGATLFVEPLPVLDLNNELQKIKKSEEEEIRRILLELTWMVRERYEGALQCVDFLSHLDLLMAKVRFSSDFRCNRPEVNNSGRIRIRGGMHPQLIEKKGFGAVVSLDMDLGSDFTTLLISGPNAGGKTVALKTAGILTLLCQCGMHIPASPDSEFSVFEKMYADIGDEQSIERDLSTFSSHITNIAKVVRNADSKSLVLLDEVGVGTDPRSGTGIAMAVLSELTRRRVRTIATSHYGDLKVFVQASKGMSNASVEFYPETLLPTYRLRMGVPGSSNTFEIAERLGMPTELLQISREFASEGRSRAEEIVQSLEQSLARSSRLAEETGLERARLKELVSKYESMLGRIRREEKDAKRRREAQARTMLEKARSLVENLVREIRESQAGPKAVRQAKKMLSDEIEKYAGPEQVRKAGEKSLEPGQTVFVELFKARGKVVSVSKNSVRVELGKVRCEVPLWSVRKSEAEKTEGEAQVRVPEASGKFELNLRGMTREEALEALDLHIDRAFMSGLSIIRIVHGKGSGVLKTAIEEALRADSRVESFREGAIEEGGWGVTIANFKT